MLPLIFLWLLVIVNCDPLLINTNSGLVRGVKQETLLSKKTYISYKGIRYAQPPVGELKFRAPVPVAPWQDIFEANNFGNACLVIFQSQLFPLNNTQSEDCLSLNIYTPGKTHADQALTSGSKKNDGKKAVMFFIHGGAFTEGDGTDGFYGPDFMLEQDVVLVTINYRLGPWGFANFDLPGYTGNMGLKDQQLALEWTKNNIEYFGGDPNLITVFGQSAGGASVHWHVLSDRSRKCIKRAIAMSGTAFSYFARSQQNNQIELIKETFDLDEDATGSDVLQFMINAPTDLILQKAPAISVVMEVAQVPWGAVIEDIEKAESPFLTESPRDIYETTYIDVEVMFGFTSGEYLLLLNPTDPYDWIEPVKNYSIGLPFFGLTLSPDSPKYRALQKKVYEFYFGTEELLPNPENLNKYVQMGTDMNFVYPAYRAMQIHSAQSKTFCYRSNKYAQLYNQTLANQTDVMNQKTLDALHFTPKMFADFAKTGYPGNFKPFTEEQFNCVHITNNDLKQIIGPRKKAIAFWDAIQESVSPWIGNEF